MGYYVVALLLSDLERSNVMVTEIAKVFELWES